jgi:eukaryotic-like serine/threonine-protein kinase
MKIKMAVKQGEGVGMEFTYPTVDSSTNLGEGDNILVGRDDPTSKAHWRLSPKDLYVSRSHFMLEIRPTTCLLRDPMSMNGTYLIRGDQPEQRVVETLLENGDQVRVGRTTLGFEIEAEEIQGTITQDAFLNMPFISSEVKPPPKPIKKSGEGICIRCGETLEELPELTGQSFRHLDFMCAKCRWEVEEELRQEAEAAARVTYLCSGKGCQRDVSSLADRDGRAVELREVTNYLCDSCAVKATDSYYQSNPRVIGDYTFLKRLGGGGMGEVFKVRHNLTGRVGALKLMLPLQKSDDRSLRRFHREISMMQVFKHPNLVRLFEAGQDGKSPYFISEFVSGGDFSQFISDDGQPTLTPEQTVRCIGDALVGLEYFHTATYVHRDLKPENILLRRENVSFLPKVADFGLSKCYEKHGGTTTREGEFAGTWMYMPPEQITDFKYSRPPVDVYAMGGTLYYLLSGCSPLPGFPAPWEVKAKPNQIRLSKEPFKIILEDRRIPLANQNSNLPARLCQVVDKALSMDAVNRYQTAEEFRQALLSVL